MKIGLSVVARHTEHPSRTRSEVEGDVQLALVKDALSAMCVFSSPTDDFDEQRSCADTSFSISASSWHFSEMRQMCVRSMLSVSIFCN